MSSIASPITLLACIHLIAASDGSSAPLRLREAVSSVIVSTSPDGGGQAVSPETETVVPTGRFVRTGPEGRAEFVMGKGVLRLGSKTTLQILERSAEIRLERGTVLFDDLPKDARLSVWLGNEPVVIEGGVGFAVLLRPGEDKPASLYVGTLHGRTLVRRGGKSILLASAHVLSLAPSGETIVGAFNLAKQLESSMLVHGFKSPLPGHTLLERQAARFASLQRRGFVQAESVPEDGRADETLRRPVGGGDSAWEPAQTGAISLGTQASASGQFNAIGAEFGVQSRTAIIVGASTTEKGNNGIGNGQDPPPPAGWQNPRNPHFGSPQNDPPAPGGPGGGHIRRR